MPLPSDQRHHAHCGLRSRSGSRLELLHRAVGVRGADGVVARWLPVADGRAQGTSRYFVIASLSPPVFSGEDGDAVKELVAKGSFAAEFWRQAIAVPRTRSLGLRE